MKSILISIKPKWVEKIIRGEKTIEVRKSAPKEVPFSDLKIYDKPKPIMQFYKPCPIEWKNCPVCEFYSTNTGCCMNNIDRPPQSYMYVEEL